MIYPKRKSEIVYNKLNDQMVIINFNSSTQFHQVNEVGSRIWELCDGTNSIDQITEMLSDEFDGNHDEILNDLKDFLKELEANELLDC